MKWIFLCALVFSSESGARLRDLGIEVGKIPPGKNNAITDVEGVRVGHVTLNSGKGPLSIGKGPVRTGVTVILPTAKDIFTRKVPAGSFVLNGNGEAMGLMWIQESGIIETPIGLTNTLSVSSVQRGILDWMAKENPGIGVTDDTITPVVLECDDSTLNDIRGQHVTPAHATEAIQLARDGKVPEGSVGAGTGMISYEFKGGIGTSSRVLSKNEGAYTVGVLLNANHGKRRNLRILGLPLNFLDEPLPKKQQDGSVVVIVATDAPLDSRQLSRLSKRVMLGIARTGAVAYHGSGDVAISFSTQNRMPHYPKNKTVQINILSDFHIDPLFEAATDAAEEALLNALVASPTMEGRDGNTVPQIPIERLRREFQKVAGSIRVRSSF